VTSSRTREPAALFRSYQQLRAAVQQAEKAGIRVAELYGPHPIDFADNLQGRRKTRLPWICFLLAIVGAAAKTAFEFWVSASDWPLNVGGKPWNSLPAFIPVTFEVMVLLAGGGAFVGFLWANRLRPGKPHRLPHESVADDAFAAVFRLEQPSLQAAVLRAIVDQSGGTFLADEEGVSRQ